MEMEELLQKSENKGRKEGGQRMLSLMAKMISSGETEQLPRLETDSDFLQEMLKKYNL